MAGEIQLNSTTMATESSGSITAELDTIRPNTTNGSLTLQGDSSDAGVTGLTIDSSGNATFAQTITGGTIGSSVVFPALGNSAVGTVSESSGTPTGDIIERGSNSNGEYVKYADGTMICTRTVTGLGPINTSSGSGYYSGTGSHSTPATFIAVPTVCGTSFDSSGAITSIVSGSSDPSTTSFGSFFLWRFTSDSSTSLELNLMAIGRWY